MGTPLASVAWLAERLSQFGRRIEPGMRVMSGSFTRQYFVDEPGTHIEARFSPYGSVVAQFTLEPRGVSEDPPDFPPRMRAGSPR